MILVKEPSWRAVLHQEFSKDYFLQLCSAVDEARSHEAVYPPDYKVFRAFDECPFENVKVVLLGQDPYHDGVSACGLSFAIGPKALKVPPSAQNILKEYADDLGLQKVPSVEIFNSWPSRGVLMLNSILTVAGGRPLSHSQFGWMTFTDAVISLISQRKRGVVFLLWGAYAASKSSLIDSSRHHILKAAHPSPLARGAFFGSRPFSKTNALLGERIFINPETEAL